MIWLGIDTANIPLSVAIVKDGEILIEENTSMAINHSLRAMPAIDEVFQKTGIAPSDINAIAVSEGPGSYTGVRIGVTIAKTLAWTLNKPLIGVSSLKALAANALYFNGLLCPIIDARRNNVYAGAYRFENGKLTAIIEDGHFSLGELIGKLKSFKYPVLFIGKDTSLHKDQLIDELADHAVFAPIQFNLPRASSLIHAAQQFEEKVDIHNFVPEYRRIAEAEANWLKAQEKGNDHG
ncbi:tRNA (adenosine(37)-N6)-threonylcarbamoyltransferase complex dimerization subunit type 1 TsaB [Sporosarcina jiandibaonis]|uniref:tRNA (adenosine(37)-N6)-threonylcarbamoyltransferase complex dimerization subunit type 1 TsaB n=1 Tax=Sporosarcina jiandibaonis TaxID=2715535 RepID=UPI001552232E|nr:tRNA (adenosine(37)-N6)-threonylcarbamoyltransferase complex dimerization subunit type 1 TsaB [Sporosarcina jiandibaonis]